MSQRKQLTQLDPKGYEPFLGFDKFIDNSELDKLHWELIKIRVSQINGCAYCLDMHIDDAIKFGEKQQRINLLSVWHDTDFFDEKERAILQLAEEITLIAGEGVSDETYNNAISVLGEKYTAAVLIAAIAMNAWNRVGITLRMQPKLKS